MLAQLRAFLVVVGEGSLNRAALRLRLSQPALSRQMQALEAEIGGRLLDRSAAGVKPTAAGHALLAGVRPLLGAYDEALAEARSLARGQLDRLRVGYLLSAAPAYVDPALASFRRSHPGTKVQLVDLSPGEQIAALRKGELDLAIIGQEGGLAKSDFYTRNLATIPVSALLPADHRLAKKKRIHLAELKGERFVSAPEEHVPGRDRWVAQLCRKAGFRPRFTPPVGGISEAMSLVSGEGAVALFPAYIGKVRGAGVAAVPLADPFCTWDFLVVWQRGKTSPGVQALVEALSVAMKPGASRKP